MPDYTGTISLSSSDTAATLDTVNGDLTLPQSYTFTTSDHGRHQFQVTFGTTGSQTLSADDSTDSLTGTATTNVNAPAVATHFAVWIPPTTLAGVPTTVSVLALDANNHIVPNYTGSVAFSVSNDPTATLPAGYTFQASDHGHTTFQVTFDTDGPQTVTVDDATNNVSGSSTTTVVPAPVATQFLVVLPPSVPAGVPVQGFIVALGADGRPVPNYTGTVAFTSSDGNAMLPANYTFQTSDHGAHAFTVTFATTGIPIGNGDRYHDQHDHRHGLDHRDRGTSPHVAEDRCAAKRGRRVADRGPRRRARRQRQSDSRISPASSR